MKLTEWLDREQIKRKDLAEAIGVTPSYITALCAGTLWPGRDIAEKIEKFTAGNVTPSDFYRVGAA